MNQLALPTRPAEIFDLFAQDSEIQRLIGKYTLDDGTVAPALVLLWPNETLPPQSRASGVELVIVRSASGQAFQGLGEMSRISAAFRMYAVQWEPEIPMDYCLDEVVLRICQLLPGCEWIDTGTEGSLDRRMDGLGQVAIKWRNPGLTACLPR